MNILFVFYSFPGIGGVESVSNNLIDYLGKYYKIYTLAFKGDDTAPKSLLISESIRFPLALELENMDSNTRFFNSTVEKYDIDCVVNQGLYPEMTQIVLNTHRDCSVRVISVLHAVPGYEKMQFWGLDIIKNASAYKSIERKILYWFGLNQRYNRYVGSYRKACRRAAEEGYKIVLLTREYEKMFIREYGLERYQDKICSIENPLPERYGSISLPDWNNRSNSLLYVGRLSQEKRVDIIIDLWKNVGRPDWYLHIVGEGPEKKYLEDKCSGLDNVIFTGYVHEPAEYYSKGKILLLTSVFEGFGMSIAEAQRFGVVPVVYDVSAGVRSVIENGGGILVRKDDFVTLCRSVQKLMKDEELLRGMSEKVYLKSDMYNLDRIGLRWKELIDRSE